MPARDLKRNIPESSRIETLSSGQPLGFVMENDATRFRQYAAECRRLAQGAAEKDKAVLMEIAAAWIACAEEAERKQRSAKKQ